MRNSSFPDGKQLPITSFVYDIPWYDALTLEDGLREAYTDLPCFDGLRLDVCDIRSISTADNGKIILEASESTASAAKYSIIAYVNLMSAVKSGRGGELLEYQEALPLLTTLDFDGKWGFGGDPGFLFRRHVLQYNSTKQVFDQQQVKLDLFECLDSERRRYERLKATFDGVIDGQTRPREPIPEAVRIAVWHRDGGKCVKCGSKERLEFDHIIPVSKGGGNTARNLELLCEACNRSKSDKIQ